MRVLFDNQNPNGDAIYGEKWKEIAVMHRYHCDSKWAIFNAIK